jgi:hypothetical protein
MPQWVGTFRTETGLTTRSVAVYVPTPCDSPPRATTLTIATSSGPGVFVREWMSD